MCEFTKKLEEIINEISSCSYEEITKPQKRECLNYWKENIKDFINFFYHLEDKESKDIFFKILRYNFAYSLFGEITNEKYALYSPQAWNALIKEASNGQGVENDYLLDKIEVYLLEGYKYKDICKVDEGDYVFDCGAYTGNTAVYFSEKTKESGKFSPLRPCLKLMTSYVKISLKKIFIHTIMQL